MPKPSAWTQGSFNGGFSDDKFLGIQNSFRYAKGVEIRENPNSLVLAHAVEKDSSTTVTGSIEAMVTIQSTDDIIAFASNGTIYRKAGGTSAWVLVYTQSSDDRIYNAIEYNEYLYWFTANKVNRIAVGSIDDAWLGEVAENYKGFTNDNIRQHPAVEHNNKLYIGDGFYLAELDSLGTWTPNKLEIFHDEEIRAITIAGTNLHIYSRKTNFQYGAQYLWNATSTTYQDRIIWEKMAIHLVYGINGIDYVVAGVRPILFQVNGYERSPIIRLPLVAAGQNVTFAPNAIDLYDNYICFGTAATGPSTLPRGVWTFGKLNHNYPDSLNFDYPTSNDNVTDVIKCVHNSNGVLYFGWKNGSTYGIDKVNTAKYRATGQLESRVMYGASVKLVKEALETAFGFAPLAAGEKIQVFYRKNLASSWTVAAELTADYATVADRGICHKELDIAHEIGDFNFIETKIVLTAGTSQATTPELCELSVLFNQGIEEGNRT